MCFIFTLAYPSGFWVTFIVALCSHNFCNFQKKNVLDPNGPYMFVLDNSKKCLSIDNFEIPSVVCSASAAYISLCRGLKYLLKVRYTILVYCNVARFLISNTVFCCRIETLPYAWKNITKNIEICVWKDTTSPNFYRMCV